MLYDKIHTCENLERAWARVRAKNAGPGIDRVTVQDFNEHLDTNLDDIAQNLAKGSYKPMPVMVYDRAKKNRANKNKSRRTVGVTTVRDKIVQIAVKQVIEPSFSKVFLSCSYAYTPGRSALNAVNDACKEIQAGKLWALRLDIANFFDSIDHKLLLNLIEYRIPEKPLLRLISRLLKNRIFREMGLFDTLVGTIQGSGLSPLLSNIYLHPLDAEAWKRYGTSYFRYSDDIAIFAQERDELLKARDFLLLCLEDLKLSVNMEKTEIVHVSDGIVFLGHHLDVNGKGPSARAVDEVHRKLEQYGSIRPRDNVDEVIDKAITEIRGWFNYYKTLTPLKPPNLVTRLALAQLALDKNQPEIARKLVKAGNTNGLRSARLCFRLAELCTATGLKNQAVREYARALELDPAMHAAGKAIMRLNEEETCHARIKKTQMALHANPHFREGYLALMEDYRLLGLYGFAEKAWQKALELDDATNGEGTDLAGKAEDEPIEESEFDYRQIDQHRFMKVFRGRTDIHSRQWVDERGRQSILYRL